jgi:predicted aspartyl protease
VDTGFTEALALPMGQIRRLGFRGPVGHQPCLLGDGSASQFPVFAGRIRWFGELRDVLAFASPSDEGLLGMGLLQGMRLIVEPDRGLVLIERRVPSDGSRRG